MWYGTPRYHYAGDSIGQLKGKTVFPVTFVTGCALIIRKAWLQTNGLLCERFFFGEEDVEFSWRVRQTGGSMLCLPTSIIYHKVGQSIGNAAKKNKIPQIYCHYLNRSIFLKTMWGNGLRWHAWKIFFYVYLYYVLLKRIRYPFYSTLLFLHDLWRDSRERIGIDSEYFHFIIRQKFNPES
ncbi:hypothetical protein GALL_468400 [mine drainage metagenome]|uniref:Uncharacterized protein n=1 Tax=mine drainage metagenome TaxID=410659 RepID=A0A1J5Q6G6_9ZZZZ